ncbi:MAG: 5-formyltetrahydrofolate cyclo-ligase [Prevotellaceae bacterium]|jgi:5-formyltetrahydrofolate cyclo-ligase|nr:5-formyltetrahydrofolate cyclo-ligase [Prevotellaceae bacterium]
MTISQRKHTVRDQAKQLLRACTPQQRVEKSNAIFSKIEKLALFSAANTILVYSSLPEEVQTQDFMLRWCEKKNIYLPVIAGNDLVFGRFNGLQSLTNTAAFGIQEPEISAETPQFDLAIIPGLAFDKHNNRLGRGKGYYDRFLKTTLAYKIGVCFDFQLLEQISVEQFDVKMDAVVFA